MHFVLLFDLFALLGGQSVIRFVFFGVFSFLAVFIYAEEVVRYGFVQCFHTLLVVPFNAAMLV